MILNDKEISYIEGLEKTVNIDNSPWHVTQEIYEDRLSVNYKPLVSKSEADLKEICTMMKEINCHFKNEI